MTGTRFRLPKRLTSQGLDVDAALRTTTLGAYVEVAYQGREIELPEEGDGSPDSLARILAYARQNRRRYVVERVEQAIEYGELDTYAAHPSRSE